MIEGFAYENLLKIGFLNENAETFLDEYKKVFDIILTGDSDAEFLEQITQSLCIS